MKCKRVQNYLIRIGQVLGQGSFGTVYKGTNENTLQQVAIKKLDKTKIQLNEYAQEALKLQIKILKKIKSQHVVRFLDVVQTQNSYYIVLQYCEGGDFKHLLALKNASLNQKEAIQYMIQILEGFYDLIKEGIVHRDIKPQNILLKNGKLKIADFGLSKPVSNQEYLYSQVGTPLYQSPQMILGEKYTYKCDIWALGIMFYILFNRYPWKVGMNFKTHIENIKSKKLEFPSEKPISKQLQLLITRCLKYEEIDRADWSDLYGSVIFQNRLSKFQNMNEKFAYVITKMRKQIHQSNLNLEMYFRSKKINKKSSMNMNEFKGLVGSISHEFTEEQIEYMFRRFDRDSNGTIQFQQFCKCLQENEIRAESMNFKKIRMTHFEDEVNKGIEDKQQKITNLSQKIVKNMEDNNIYDLYSLFVSYNNSQGVLKFSQLESLLKQIYPQITHDEATLIFQKFDQNGDKKVTFKEFYKGMCLMTGTPDLSNSVVFNK